MMNNNTYCGKCAALVQCRRQALDKGRLLACCEKPLARELRMEPAKPVHKPRGGKVR